MKELLYLHGFASDDNAFKAGFLRNKLDSYPKTAFYVPSFNATPADFKYKTITAMIGRLRQYILCRELKKPFLIASSLSGIVALNYARRYGSLSGILLLSPMTRFIHLFTAEEEKRWRSKGEALIDSSLGKQLPLLYDFVRDGENYKEMPAPPPNTVIIHGRADSIVPISESRLFADLFGIQLLETNSDHSLATTDSLDLIWQTLKKQNSLV